MTPEAAGKVDLRPRFAIIFDHFRPLSIIFDPFESFEVRGLDHDPDRREGLLRAEAAVHLRGRRGGLLRG